MSSEGRAARPTPGHGPELFSTPSLLALAVVAFVVELALFGGAGAIAHHAVGGGLVGWVAAVVAVAAVLILWGLFMAPKGRFRLQPGARVGVAALLCLATAYGLVDAGWSACGWVVGIAGIAVVAAQLVLPTAEPAGR